MALTPAVTIAGVFTSVPYVTATVTSVVLFAQISSSVALPAPVVEASISYGAIISGIFSATLAIVGLVTMFVTMRNALQSLVKDVNSNGAKLDRLHNLASDVKLNRHILNEHERRLHDIEHTLYMDKAGVMFGKTAATHSGAFVIEDAGSVRLPEITDNGDNHNG